MPKIESMTLMNQPSSAEFLPAGFLRRLGAACIDAAILQILLSLLAERLLVNYTSQLPYIAATAGGGMALVATDVGLFFDSMDIVRTLRKEPIAHTRQINFAQVAQLSYYSWGNNFRLQVSQKKDPGGFLKLNQTLLSYAEKNFGDSYVSIPLLANISRQYSISRQTKLADPLKKRIAKIAAESDKSFVPYGEPSAADLAR